LWVRAFIADVRFLENVTQKPDVIRCGRGGRDLCFVLDYIKTAAVDVRNAMTKLENHIAEADRIRSDTMGH
jgi:hypothetical protein